jgi:hypothetical protein
MTTMMTMEVFSHKIKRIYLTKNKSLESEIMVC